jgi:hypothetical protein
MDWNLAIERNRAALKRIVAMLVSLTELAGGRATLPRHLHRALLRLLRPAESAVRRLIVIAARGLVVPAPRHRKQKPKPKPVVLHRTLIGVIPIRQHARPDPAPAPPARLALPLLDPLPRWPKPRVAHAGVPRISVPGVTALFPVAARVPPMPDDPIDAARLTLRLSALSSALEDLPAQARRLARWTAARTAARDRNRDAAADGSGPGTPVRYHRFSPLRPGRPPGRHPAFGRREVHEVYTVLDEIHGLARWSLTAPDTS